MHFTSYFISFRENFLSLLTIHSMCSTWVPHNFWSIYSHNAEVKGDAKVSIKVNGKKRASTLIPWHSSQSVKWTLFSHFTKIYFDSKLFPSPASYVVYLFIFFPLAKTMWLLWNSLSEIVHGWIICKLSRW